MRVNELKELTDRQVAWANALPQLEILERAIQGPYTFEGGELHDIAADRLFDPMVDWTIGIGYQVTATLINHGKDLVYIWPDTVTFLEESQAGARLASSQSWRGQILGGEQIRFVWTPQWHLEIWMRRYAFVDGTEYSSDLSPIEGWTDELTIMSNADRERDVAMKLQLILRAEPVEPKNRHRAGRVDRPVVRAEGVNSFKWGRGTRGYAEILTGVEVYPGKPE